MANGHDHFVITTRRLKRDGTFIAEPGPTRFLRVPDTLSANTDFDKTHEASSTPRWVADVIGAATTSVDPVTHVATGDILVFVHGFNNKPRHVMNQHRMLHQGLAGTPQTPFAGALVSFDWPAGEGYLEDRHDAKVAALRLVREGITLFCRNRRADCRINVHVLAKSMGAFVVREAFEDADDFGAVADQNWAVSQLALVAADISSGSLAEGDPRTDAVYRHCQRLTNYANRHDRVLKLSNRKRLGLAPRAGRAGLPVRTLPKAVNVDCSARFRAARDAAGDRSTLFSHSWHFEDPVWLQDLTLTLSGDDDRNVIATRTPVAENRLELNA